MKALAITVLAVSVPLSGLGQCQNEQTLENSQDGRDVLQIVKELGEANSHHDEKLLGKVLADAFIATVDSGRRLTKSQWISELSAAFKENTYESFTSSNECIRLFAGTAVHNFLLTEKGRGSAGSFTHFFRITDIFANAGGRWQAVGSHVSLVRVSDQNYIAAQPTEASGAQAAKESRTFMTPAQPLPTVDLVYPSPYGSMIDRLCSELFNTQIEPKWIQETVQRLPEFQALWDKEGPAYLSVVLREVGLAYPFREVQATLTVCPGALSMGSPLMVKVSRFLSSEERPLPASLFSLFVFHELMHRYVTPVHATSGLRKKYASEPLITLNMLHLMALEKLVLLKLGKSEELRILDEIYRTQRRPEHKRAWEIVNEKESYEAFVSELKLLEK